MLSSPALTETVAPVAGTLVTGHFNETRGYHTWRAKGTNDYLLMLTLSGSGRIGWEGGEYHTSAGDLILLSPRTPHDYGIAPDASTWEIGWAHFLPYPHWLPLLNLPTLAPGVSCLRLAPARAEAKGAVTAALRTMHERAVSGLVRREAWAMNALEEALLHCDSVNPEAGGIVDARIAQTVRHLRQHLAEPFYLPHLAAQVGLSASRLSHLFRAETGQTPRQFLERERLSRAAQLLKFTSSPVHAVASDVGFDNPFYFSLRFKAETGLAPRDFRRRSGGQE